MSEIITNPTLTLIHARRSTRAFDLRPVEPEVKLALMEATLRAPTAGNNQFYTVIDVTDQALKDKLAVLCDNQPMIGKAPIVWVFLADCQKWNNYFIEGGSPERFPDLSWRNPGLGDMHLALQDAIIAAQTAAIAAESLGLGSCYIGDIVENYEKVRDALGLVRYTIPACMLIMGYPKPGVNDRPLVKRCPVSAIFMENSYREPHLEQLKADFAELESDMHEAGTLPADISIADRYYKRKYTSGFMKEMNRSAKVFISRWENG